MIKNPDCPSCSSPLRSYNGYTGDDGIRYRYLACDACKNNYSHSIHGFKEVKVRTFAGNCKYCALRLIVKGGREYANGDMFRYLCCKKCKIKFASVNWGIVGEVKYGAVHSGRPIKNKPSKLACHHCDGRLRVRDTRNTEVGRVVYMECRKCGARCCYENGVFARETCPPRNHEALIPPISEYLDKFLIVRHEEAYA